MENEIEISGTQQMFIKKKDGKLTVFPFASVRIMSDIMYSDFKRHLT